MFKIYKGGDTFFQWDIGQRLVVEDAELDRVHFCNKTGECALVCNVYEENGLRLVNVPNILLQDTNMVRVYGCLVEGEDSYFAKAMQAIKVIARTKPEDYIYTEAELKNWDTIDERLAQIERDIEELEAIGFDNLARKTEVQAVSNRLDNAIAATTLDSNTELKDIRVGADGVTYTTAGAAVRTQLQNKLNASSIVQTTGESENSVMSQKATSAYINNHESRISRNEKQITNLVKGISGDLFVEDNTVAYIKNVPTGVLPYAEVGAVGGMSRKCENLIPFPYAFGSSYTTWGVTFTANSDGSVTLNGTFGASAVINVDLISQANAITLPAGSYYISGIPLNGNPVGFVGSIYSLNGTLEKYIYPNAFTITEPKKFGLLMQLAVGSSFSKNTFYPMLNKGSAALPYESYYKGLRDVKVTAVESIGVNLFSGEISAKTAPTIYSFANGTLKLLRNGGAIQGGFWSKEKYLKGTYTISLSLSGMSNANFILATATTASASSTGTWLKTWYSNGNVSFTFTLSQDSYIGFFTDGSNIEITAANIMLNKGSSTLSYKPYIKSTLVIPEEVQALEGYGLGVSADYCNHINWEKKKFIREVKAVDLGSLEWSLNNANVFQSQTLGKIGDYLTCANYDFAGLVSGNAAAYECGDKKISLYATDKRIYIRDDAYTTAAAFKSAVSGLMLVYVLNTPVEVDVSESISYDNLIVVEGGGTVTAINENKFNAPSEITYQLKEGN